MCLYMLRASTSVDVKLCKIQKPTNFTHFVPKIFYISLFKTVYIYKFATVTMHICTVTVNVYPIILLISHSHLFFSLFSVHNELSDFSSPHLLFPQIHTNTPTHKHIHTDKSTQRYTNTPTHKQTHTDKPTERQIGAWLERSMLDRCLIGTIGAWSMLVGQREWVLMLAAEIGAWLERFSTCASVIVGQCLWQRWYLRQLKGRT